MSCQSHPLCIALVLTAALSLPAADAPRADGFRVETRRDAKVHISTEGERSVWGVRSPSGIGSATVQRTSARWPKTVVLRMHLKGLESLRVSNGRVTLEVAASSTKDGEVRASLRHGEQEQPIDDRHPLWPHVRITDPDGNAAPEGRRFEVTLPAALFERNPERITLEWVDFFRG